MIEAEVLQIPRIHLKYHPEFILIFKFQPLPPTRHNLNIVH